MREFTADDAEGAEKNMTHRLEVLKTYKLYIDGKFPRSESGRSLPVRDARGVLVAHLSRASRKDLREAVEAARRAQAGWAGATAYNRGQVLYRMAEMLEGKREEFESVLGLGVAKGEENIEEGRHGQHARATRGGRGSGSEEVACAIDRLVHYAGWADKFSQVLGCNNPVSGPYYNFTVPEATGVVAVVAPDSPSLLGLVSLLAPVICSGNAAVCVASEGNPIPAAVFGEVCATSDVPVGVVNILTGERQELLPHISAHRDIDAVHAGGLSAAEHQLLRLGITENLKRVTCRDMTPAEWFDDATCQSPWWIEPFVEMKTMWHPASA